MYDAFVWSTTTAHARLSNYAEIGAAPKSVIVLLNEKMHGACYHKPLPLCISVFLLRRPFSFIRAFILFFGDGVVSAAVCPNIAFQCQCISHQPPQLPGLPSTSSWAHCGHLADTSRTPRSDYCPGEDGQRGGPLVRRTTAQYIRWTQASRSYL